MISVYHIAIEDNATVTDSCLVLFYNDTRTSNCEDKVPHYFLQAGYLRSATEIFKYTNA